MRTASIIVATDGTASSKAAVRWAAREAERRNRLLRIMHVFDWEWREDESSYAGPYGDLARKTAEGVVAGAFDLARRAAPQVQIETDTLIGHAASRLLAMIADADLVVLGSRGRGGFASLLLGSVSQRVATHARCSVVIVRGRGDTAEGPVVVGVDEARDADHVLETAFEAAAGRGCPLAVVHAYLPTVPLWVRGVAATDIDTPDEDAAEQSGVEETLAPWRAKFPEVPATITVSHESAAAALVHASHRASLVVVGSHNHGVVASAFLGSTGMQLLHHADCPVYIARPHLDAAAAR